MERWKVVIIGLLLAGLVGYGALQQNMASNPPAPTNPPGVQPTPTPNPVVQRFEGKTIPGWSIPASFWMNGKAVTPGDTKGRVTLLEFFRIECSHCQEAAPFMQHLHKTYVPRGLKMVAIQSPGTAPTENNWDTVQEWVRERGLTYPIGFDKGGAIFRKQYGGTNYPTMLLLDRKGVVRLAMTGHDAQKEQLLLAQIEKLLKEK